MGYPSRGSKGRSLFDERLTLEELQSAHFSRLWYLVEHAILAGDIEVVMGPSMKPTTPVELTMLSTSESGGSMKVKTPECGYSVIDIFDDQDSTPVQKPTVLPSSSQKAIERYVRRKSYCVWVEAKGYHVPADLQDEVPSGGNAMAASSHVGKSTQVMVVHGRNEAIREGMFDFLRAWG